MCGANLNALLINPVFCWFQSRKVAKSGQGAIENKLLRVFLFVSLGVSHARKKGVTFFERTRLSTLSFPRYNQKVQNEYQRAFFESIEMSQIYREEINLGSSRFTVTV